MNESKSMSKGPVLRELGGGAVRIITTRADWETRRIGDGVAVGQSLIAFEAMHYRELHEGCDIWVFTIEEDGRKFNAYLGGDEIFMVYIASALA